MFFTILNDVLVQFRKLSGYKPFTIQEEIIFKHVIPRLECLLLHVDPELFRLVNYASSG